MDKNKFLSVTDPNLAGALFSVGVPPDPRGCEDLYVEDGRRYTCWHFLDRTADGLDLTAKLIDAWKHPDAFNAAHPQHRFSYIMIGMKNAAELRDRARRRVAKAIIRSGPSVAVVDPADSRARKEAVLQMIGL